MRVLLRKRQHSRIGYFDLKVSFKSKGDTHMKSMKIAGLCLVAMFVVSMVASATASAAGPVWEQCTTEKVSTLTKWEDSKCTKALSTGALNWKEITNTEKVETNGTLELKDKETLLGESAVICTGTDKGSIGPGKFDRIESITTHECKAVKVCEATPTAKPVNLPWQTELFETEKKIRDKITENGNGQPGWSVTCSTIGGPITDVCTTVAGSEGTPEVTNKQAAGNVQITFTEASGSASCTQGKPTSGKVVGAIQVFTAAYAIRVQ